VRWCFAPAGTSVAFAQSAPAGDAASAQVVLATTAASYANSSVAPSARRPSTTAKGTTHVRPLFGDLSDLADAEPGAKVEFDSLGKPRLTDRIQNVLTKAMTLLGTPYRWGGEVDRRLRLQRPGRLRLPHRARHGPAARLPPDGAGAAKR
jgi:cell wall-associated NlpC family hydrolase